jgi:hypothetical protein
MTLSVIACDADHPVRPKSKPPADPTTQPTSNMKISIKLQDNTLTGTLYDTPTARDFASMLPLTLTLEDYAKTEKVSDLPKKLTIQSAPAGAKPSAGDIAYYAPWGNLALFYKDFDYSEGLIILGKLDGGADALKESGSFKGIIELLQRQ